MGKLWIVPTPIGNLQDITLRALEILKECDAVLAEDTRVSKRLLHRFEIDKPLSSFHKDNEHKILQRIIDRLEGGDNLALISDAGTPAISDPGFLLVRACVEHGIEVETLPGPTAFVPALVNSGIPCDRFFFQGFLPQKKGKQTRMIEMSESPFTSVFYESPHRLVKTLTQLMEFCGEDRLCSVSRELSKMFEETKRGSLKEVRDYFEEKGVKGEIVVVLSGKV